MTDHKFKKKTEHRFVRGKLRFDIFDAVTPLLLGQPLSTKVFNQMSTMAIRLSPQQEKFLTSLVH